MAYKVLYRKYRPTNFSEMVGQKTIVENLKKSIEQNSFSHAYLFTGPRGTGKTSMAKVLAKAINCSNFNGDICEKCANCQNFNTSPDIIEIDAASNNGVDEIRELRNNVTLAPAASKYKIYIIDEVHMLSPGAFNALLKTLEEPPSHVIFILATTEVYKVPITILSRCQRYDFKKINKDEMILYLKEICHKENIQYEEEALYEIYSLSEGCLRDALSILDQISKTADRLTLENILSEYNIISDNSVKELLDATIKNDVEKVINRINEFENSGMNAQKLIKKIINFLEDVAINIKAKKEHTYDFKLISHLIRSLNDCYINARINENVFTILKLCFLELISESTNSSNVNMPKKDKVVETEVIKKINEPQKIIANKEELSPIDIRINNCFVGANRDSLRKFLDIWIDLDEKIKIIDVTEYKPVVASKDYVVFSAEESSLVNLFNIKIDEIESLLKKENINVKIVAITNEQWNNEKEKYKNALKKGAKYVLMDEPKKKTDETTEIKNEIKELFNNKTIEIS